MAEMSDPLSIPATVLPSGPSALDIGFKRMGLENEQAKLAQQKLIAADKIKQKQKEANAKPFEIEFDTVSLPDTLAWNKMMGTEQGLYAQQLKDYAEGKGGDPDDPRSPAGMERLARMRGYKQWVSNSKQKQEFSQGQLKLLQERPFEYRDPEQAKQAVLNYWSDPDVNDTGDMMEPLRAFYDLDKAMQTQLGDLMASGSGQAYTLPDGSIKETQSERVTPDAVLNGINLVLQNKHASDEALVRFGELAQADPERARAVRELAANKGISTEAAMLWNEAFPVYSYKKYRETQTAPNEGGAGVKADERASLWLGKVLEGYMEGTYGEASDQLGEPGEGFGTGEMRRIVKDPTTLVGWKWDVKDVYDPGADKNIKVVEEIKDFEVDPQAQVFRVTVGPAKGDGAARVEEIRFDEAESKLVPRISGNNKDQMRGIGIYDIAAEKTGEGTRKAAGAQNIVKTPARGPSFNAPTTGGGLNFNVPR